jgi:hypothetical protein
MTGPRAIFADRNIAMRDMYKSGQTLEEIGAAFGVTRERVRQVLSRQFGVSSEEGGQAIKCFLSVRDKLEKRSREAALRNAKDFAKWGMTTEDIGAVSDLPRSDNHHPLRKFNQQRVNARRRGLGWGLTFKQWWGIWQESGLWDKRGKGQGYCMARHGDSDGYTPENVYICTIGQNFSDSYLAHPAAERVAKRNARRLYMVAAQ